MNLYVIYDNLYEEYQHPFCMKNDNIAKLEFDQFLTNAIQKAPDKEKENTANRFYLCKFKNITFDRDAGRFEAKIDHPESKFTGEIHYFETEMMTRSEDDE